MKKVWICRDNKFIYYVGNHTDAVLTKLDLWYSGYETLATVEKVCTKKLKRLKKYLDKLNIVCYHDYRK